MTDGGVATLKRATGGRRIRRDTLLYALAAQAVVLLIAVYVVVVRPAMREEPAFTGETAVYLPQRELEHRAAMAEFEQMAARPLPLEKLATNAMLPPDLPALPAVPKSDFSASDSSDMLARDAQALLAQSGFAGAMSGLKNVKSTAAFFGVEAEGERIVIVVNTMATYLRLLDPFGGTLLLVPPVPNP